MTVALATQLQAIVFDGVNPAYQDVRTPAAAVFPWLIQFSDISGDLIDMSGTSGSPSVGWTARWVVTSATATLLTVVSGTATAGGSQITFVDSAGGELEVLGGKTDMAALATHTEFLEHRLYVTDQFGNTYKAVYGLLYPCSDSG